MMRTEWYEQVAGVAADVANKPVLPGEPHPLIKVLEWFADKLLGSCHNGGAIGKDECPACRAYRTEKVESVLAAFESKAEHALATSLRVEKDAAVEHSRHVAVSEALDQAVKGLNLLEGELSAAREDLAGQARRMRELGERYSRLDASRNSVVAAAANTEKACLVAETRIQALQDFLKDW